MKNYVDKDKLQEYTTKLTAKNKTIFATKAEVGSPLVASTIAEMTDTSKVYVYVGSETGYTSGNWYYYDGSAWVSGGIYNSTAFVTDTTLTQAGMAADAKATGDEVGSLKQAFSQLSEEITTVNEKTETVASSMPSSFFAIEDITPEIVYTSKFVDYEGNESDSTARVTSNYIELGKQIVVTNSNASENDGIQFWIRCYDATKSFVSNAKFTSTDTCYVGTGTGYGTTGSATTNLDAILSVDSTIKYVRLVVRYMATTSTPIIPSDVWLTYTGKVLVGGSLDDVYLTGPVSPDNVSFLHNVHSENLFDKTKIVTGRLTNSGTIDATATSYFTSDYIDISDVDTSYYIVPCISSTNIGANGYAFYNSSKSFISGSGSSSNTAKPIPSGAKFFRASYGIASLNSFAVVANSTGTVGTDNKEYYSRYMLADDIEEASWYVGKKATALGDSITANGNISGTTHSGWRNYVANEMMFADVIYNCGIGGTRVSGSGSQAMWQDTRINAIPTDTDVLFFNGGMNDWGGNALLGEEDSMDTNTFYGALNTIVQKIMARVPNALIVFMTTTLGYQNGSLKNTQNLTTYDYGRAIKKVAEKNGFLCVDLHALSGINIYNMSTYINNDGTSEAPIYIHPNLQAGPKLTTVICSVLKAYQPITD